MQLLLLPSLSHEGRQQNSIDNHFSNSASSELLTELTGNSRVQNNLIVQDQKHGHHRRNRPSNSAQINSNSNSASGTVSRNTFTSSKIPTRPESQFHQDHHSNRLQDHHQYTRNHPRSNKHKANNCTLDVSEDETFLWRIDTQPPSYFFGTIHVPYTRVWDAVSDNAKKAFKVIVIKIFQVN